MSRLDPFILIWFSAFYDAQHRPFSKHPSSEEEILTETPDDDEFDDQLLCFELMTSLNSDEDVVKVMGADVPLAVQVQAFPELAGLFKMERKAAQDRKDWAEAMALKAERDREREIERVRNELIILNRFYRQEA